MSKEAKQNQLNIEIDEKTADGTYANLAIINHSISEFVVDFINVMPGSPKSKVKSRIILTPEHAKRLNKALTDNINKFEALHGHIKETKQENMPPFTMGGPTAQA